MSLQSKTKINYILILYEEMMAEGLHSTFFTMIFPDSYMMMKKHIIFIIDHKLRLTSRRRFSHHWKRRNINIISSYTECTTIGLGKLYGKMKFPFYYKFSRVACSTTVTELKFHHIHKRMQILTLYASIFFSTFPHINIIVQSIKCKESQCQCACFKW